MTARALRRRGRGCGCAPRGCGCGCAIAHDPHNAPRGCGCAAVLATCCDSAGGTTLRTPTPKTQNTHRRAARALGSRERDREYERDAGDRDRYRRRRGLHRCREIAGARLHARTRAKPRTCVTAMSCCCESAMTTTNAQGTSPSPSQRQQHPPAWHQAAAAQRRQPGVARSPRTSTLPCRFETGSRCLRMFTAAHVYVELSCQLSVGGSLGRTRAGRC